MKKYLLFLSVVLLFACPELSRGAYSLGSAPKLPGVSELNQQVVAELTSMDSDLAGATQKLSVILPTGGDPRPILRKFFDNHSSVVDIAIVDPDGLLRIIEPSNYKSYEGKAINGMDQINLMANTKRPLLSEQFKTAEGFFACSLAYPMFSTDGKLLGFVSAVFKPDALLKKIVGQYSTTTPTIEILMLQLDGRIIYDKDILQIGQLTFSSPEYQKYPSLLALANRITAEASGVGTYEYLPQYGKTAVKKEAAWSTIVLHGREWRLVVSKIIS